MKKYGKTEKDLLVEKSIECRNIVKEIIRYGVSEFQKKKIIYLLSLELEDGEIMKEITSLVHTSIEDKDEANGLIKIDQGL